jgi:hypothetical protein
MWNEHVVLRIFAGRPRFLEGSAKAAVVGDGASSSAAAAVGDGEATATVVALVAGTGGTAQKTSSRVFEERAMM